MLKKSVIVLHRWLGVALCLFFLLWFPSGIGMMYWDFPGVTADDRLERSAPIDPSTIRLSPSEAFASTAQLQAPSHAHLTTFDNRPVYRFRVGRSDFMVYADTGALQTEPVPPAIVERAASAWVRQPVSGAAVETLEEADQWTVQGSFRTLRPLQKYSFANGEQVYVSRASGEVVQYTTRRSRLGAYLGPIPHWIYYTPVRKHQPAWNQIVIWSSGIGTVTGVLGIAIGVWMWSPSRRYRFEGAPSRLPYRGQKRWHALFGLIFGLGAVTWAFSGLLSMDPVPRMNERPRLDGPHALRGQLRLSAFAAKNPRQALSQLSGLSVKALELAVVAGEPVYLASAGRGQTRVVPVTGPPREGFDRDRIVHAVDAAAQPDRIADARVIDRYDAYYLDRHHERPLPVMLVQLGDSDHTRYYIDPKTARVVGSYSSRTWMSRWLYHGLHSLDFPWLYDYRPLWDIVVITFMLGGTALCVTSLILAWRVLGSYLPSR
jgi:PepSY-associated transmembrane protein